MDLLLQPWLFCLPAPPFANGPSVFADWFFPAVSHHWQERLISGHVTPQGAGRVDPPAGEAEEELGPPVEPRGLHRGPDGRAAGGSCSLGQDEGEKGSVEIDLVCFFFVLKNNSLQSLVHKQKWALFQRSSAKKKEKRLTAAGAQKQLTKSFSTLRFCFAMWIFFQCSALLRVQSGKFLPQARDGGCPCGI